ncbi:MAG: PaaI family thioesterase [Burkholderiales bacterium]|nr:MAG: PaaI family thioesterase [Burkholderiales bacterium]TAG81854.1 MAG: PaaI family thioesterase [Betaproteobacteria bacterium]
MLDPAKLSDIEAIIAAQGAMRLIGVEVVRVERGETEFAVNFRPELSQQNGFFHAGIVSTLVDTAGGCAGVTAMPPGAGVLTVEFKLNLLAPADGERIVARAEVVKSGRTLTITQGRVFVYKNGVETLCALMQQTLISMPAKTVREPDSSK